MLRRLFPQPERGRTARERPLVHKYPRTCSLPLCKMVMRSLIFIQLKSYAFNVTLKNGLFCLFLFSSSHSLRELLACRNCCHRSGQQLALHPVKGHVSGYCKFNCCYYSFNANRSSADKCRRPGERKLPPACRHRRAEMPHSSNPSHPCAGPQTCNDIGLPFRSFCSSGSRHYTC